MGYRNNCKIFVICYLICYCVETSLGDYFEECEGIDDETFVASLTDCQTYIYCNGDDSLAGYCEDGEYFDAESYSCDDAENVYCPLDDYPEESTTPEESTEDETTTAPETALTTESVLTTSTFDTLTVPPVIKDSCPITDDPSQIILMANTQSCADYYVCYHGHAIEMHCTNHLHFNTHTGKCDFPENVQCLADRPNANKCLPHITDFFPHPEKCNYFYYCIKGFMIVQQCPFYYGWDIERRTCVHISQAKCFNSDKTSVLTNKMPL